MINRVKAKIFTQKITGAILCAPVQNIGGFDRIIFCTTLPTVGIVNVLYVDKDDLTQYIWNGTDYDMIVGGAIEMRVDGGFIQWQFNGDGWVNLIELSLLKGDKGDTGETGANGINGTNGADGADGTPVELQVSANILQWRYVGDFIWINLIDFSTIIPDLSDYLLKDTTLQNADTPEDTSLFSFWKIGVGRVKIAFSELITNVRHSQLRGLEWLTSGHTGTANKLFGSDENGVAKEYALTDFGGAKRLVIQKNIAMGGGSCWAIVCGDRIIENVYGTLRKFDFSGSWISSTAAARVPSVNQNVWNNSEKFAINNLTTGIVDIYTKECTLVGSVTLSNYVSGNSIVGFIIGDYLYWANKDNVDHSVYKLSLTDFTQTTALNITTGNSVSDLKMAEFNGEYRIFYYSTYGTRIFDVNFNVLKTFSSYSDYYRVSGRYLFYKYYNASPSSIEVYDLFSASIPLVCNTDIVLFGDIKQLAGDIYYGVTTIGNNGYNSELVVFNPVTNKVLDTVSFFLYGYYGNAIQKPLYYKISDSKLMLWGYTALFKIISYE